LINLKSDLLKLKAIKYYIINEGLFWKDPGGTLLKCIDEDESNRVMKNLHKGVCGGNQVLERNNIQNTESWVLLAHSIF
jgi:hypothetical protein